MLPNQQNDDNGSGITFPGVYGGLTTDHPLLQELVWNYEPDFPAIRRDLSRAINELEKSHSDKEIVASLLLSTATANFVDAAGRNPAGRMFANLSNTFVKIRRYFTAEDEVDLWLGSHEEAILDFAKDLHQTFHRALRVIDEKDSNQTPIESTTFQNQYYGLNTDHPTLRKLIFTEAANNPTSQRALSLAVNGIEQNHSQQRIDHDLTLFRSSFKQLTTASSEAPGPKHPVTPAQQGMAKSDTPQLVATPVAIKPLPANRELLNAARQIHADFQHQQRLQQPTLSSPNREAEALSSASNTPHNTRHHGADPGAQPLQRQREIYRPHSRGR